MSCFDSSNVSKRAKGSPTIRQSVIHCTPYLVTTPIPDGRSSKGLGSFSPSVVRTQSLTPEVRGGTAAMSSAAMAAAWSLVTKIHPPLEMNDGGYHIGYPPPCPYGIIFATYAAVFLNP